VVLLLGLQCVGGSLGDRRPLAPPPPVEFRPLEHVSQEYLAELAGLGEAIEELGEPGPKELLDVLTSTLDQPLLLDTVALLLENLEDLLGRTSPGDEARRSGGEEAAAWARRVRDRILSREVYPGYLGDNYPIELEADPERRVYVLKWRDWSSDGHWGSYTGEYVVWEVPFVPRMEIAVAAIFVETTGPGAFGYRVRNGLNSRPSTGIRHLFVESVGLTVERIRLVGQGMIHHSLPDGNRVSLSVPWTSGSNVYPRNFHFALYDSPRPDAMGVRAKPGEELAFPPILEVPWPSLPGVVRCWVDAGDYSPRLNAHAVPEHAVRMFYTGGGEVRTEAGVKIVRANHYDGKTIGPVPVPVPEPDERAEFVERIGEYLREARYWGWCPDGELADRLEAELARIDPSAPDPEQIARLLQEVELAAESGHLLHEAYVLLKYNLEYLADPSHWE
jgi:hypothetical protein